MNQQSNTRAITVEIPTALREQVENVMSNFPGMSEAEVFKLLLSMGLNRADSSAQ